MRLTLPPAPKKGHVTKLGQSETLAFIIELLPVPPGNRLVLSIGQRKGSNMMHAVAKKRPPGETELEGRRHVFSFYQHSTSKTKDRSTSWIFQQMPFLAHDA